MSWSAYAASTVCARTTRRNSNGPTSAAMAPSRCHQLLIFADAGAARDPALDWARRHSDVVRPLVVTAQAGAGDVDVVADPAGALRHRYAAASSRRLYLVRPDGYIAASSRMDDTAPLTAYLDCFLELRPSG